MISVLLPFWKPIAIGVAIVVLAIAVGVEKHRYDNAKIAIGRAEIQAKWDADKAARIQAVTDQVNRWDAERQKFDKAEQELANERNIRTALAADAAKRLPAAVASVRVPAAAARVLNDAIDAGNTTKAAGPAAEPAKAPAAVAEYSDSTVGLLTQWGVQCIAAYDEARGMVEGWQDWYASLQKAQPQ